MATLEPIKGIPLFAGLESRELEDFLRIFERAAYEPGACVTRQGQPADCALIMESGNADVVTALPGGGEVTVATLGPGSVLGEMALLELNKPAFDRLFSGSDRLAARFQDAINQELLRALARTNNHLTRLISQARIRAARADVEELQRALCTQDCRAA